MTNTVTDIRGIKGLVVVPYPWWVWAVMVAVLVLITLGLWWWQRRKPVALAEAVKPPTPFEVALAALRQLQAENPPVEAFYTRLSDIVRHYIEGQFGLRAPERTTEEFLAEAALPAQHLALLGAFLQEADLVKFAKFQPGAEDRQRAFAAAEKFVNETRGSGIPAATDSGDNRGANAAPPKISQ